MLKISDGFSRDPYSGSSVIIKSISTFAWMKSPSVERLTVPLIPIRQCSFKGGSHSVKCWPIKTVVYAQYTLVRWKTAFGSRFFEWPGASAFVLIQQMSSHRRKPHRRKHTRPRSRPSLEPHHKNMKLLGAATSPISSSIIWEKLEINYCSSHTIIWQKYYLIPWQKIDIRNAQRTLIFFQWWLY